MLELIVPERHQTSWSRLLQVMACCLSAPGHYLNQCWLIDNWNTTKKLQWNLKWNMKILFQQNHFKMVSAKGLYLLSLQSAILQNAIRHAEDTTDTSKVLLRTIYSWKMVLLPNTTLLKNAFITNIFRQSDTIKNIIQRLSHCGLVMPYSCGLVVPYSDIGQGQHWLR